MIRSLHPSPGAVDHQALAGEIAALITDLRGVNDVDGQVAVYTDTPHDEVAVGIIVSNHQPPSALLDPLLALADAIFHAATLDDVKTVAAQILSDAGVEP